MSSSGRAGGVFVVAFALLPADDDVIGRMRVTVDPHSHHTYIFGHAFDTQ